MILFYFNSGKELNFFIPLISFPKKVEDESVGVFFNGIIGVSCLSCVDIPLQIMPCDTPLSLS